MQQYALHSIDVIRLEVRSSTTSPLLGTKPHSLHQVLQSKEGLMTVSNRIFLLCNPLKYNYAIRLIYGTLVLVLAKTEALCVTVAGYYC